MIRAGPLHVPARGCPHLQFCHEPAVILLSAPFLTTLCAAPFCRGALCVVAGWRGQMEQLRRGDRGLKETRGNQPGLAELKGQLRVLEQLG